MAFRRRYIIPPMTDYRRADAIALGRSYARTGQGRQIRLASGASLRDWARLLRVSQVSILRWESGQLPRGDNAVRYGRLCKRYEAEQVPA